MRTTTLIQSVLTVVIFTPAIGQPQSAPIVPAKVRARAVITPAVETFPTWIEQGDLLFYTRRKSIVDGKEVDAQGFKEHGEFSNVWALAIYSPSFKDSKFRTLVQMPSVLQPPAYSTTNKRVAFSSGTQVGLLSLSQENFGAVNKNRVFRFDASWSADGQSLVMSGTHSPSDTKNKSYQYDRDLFISTIKPMLGPASLVNNRCILRIRGVEKLPTYDERGEWIYFARNSTIIDSDLDSKKELKNWTICRIKANSLWSENPIPEILVAGLNEPDRITFFDKGKRLLVSGMSSSWLDEKPVVVNVIDIARKKTAPLKISPIFDPDKPELGALSPRQMTISKYGTKLAFSALLWSGLEGERGWISIYTCDFDGKNVERITPLDKSAIPAYEYKKSTLSPLTIWDEAFKLD